MSLTLIKVTIVLPECRSCPRRGPRRPVQQKPPSQSFVSFLSPPLQSGLCSPAASLRWPNKYRVFVSMCLIYNNDMFLPNSIFTILRYMSENSICLSRKRRTILHKINVSFGCFQLFKQKFSPRICVINPGG